MTDRIERAGRLTKETLVPVGLVIGVCGLTWLVATDRAGVGATLIRHDVELKAIRQGLEDIEHTLTKTVTGNKAIAETNQQILKDIQARMK